MLCLTLAVSSAYVGALRLPQAADRCMSRRALLGAAAATTSLQLPSLAFAKDKGYMTMDEYQAAKRQQARDEKLYGLFESLRSRAGQTSEFDKLASDDKYKEITKLALAWDADIRKEVLDKANEQLDGGAKANGSALSKTILEDLKRLDKLAKASNKDEIPDASAALRGHVLEFVALEPKRLADKFGVDDL